MSQYAASRPTAKQLSYLKALAVETGTSFVYPKTRRDASREIERLKALKTNGRRPMPEPRQPDREAVYGTAPRADEIAGYGSQAHWRGRNSEPEKPPKPARPKVGQRGEIMRYRAGTEQRVLYRQRVGQSIRITDRPARGKGRAYLVEADLAQDGEGAIDAIVEDYVAQAQRLGRVPMALVATSSGGE